MKTEKVYYEDSFLCSCKARVIEKTQSGIITDRTVAYAEGGGQEGDCGFIIVNNGMEIPFYDTQKGCGRLVTLPDFPLIQIDTPICHCIDEQYMELFSIGDEVQIYINVQHRINTTVHHSALHIALMAAEQICPEKVRYIKGCKITGDYGRLDFNTSDKFTPEDIKGISHKVNEIIEKAIPVLVYQHPNEKEAWFWKCEDFVCPCGGMHITNTNEIEAVSIKRKNVGKFTERMIVEVGKPCLDIEKYHI